MTPRELPHSSLHAAHVRARPGLLLLAAVSSLAVGPPRCGEHVERLEPVATIHCGYAATTETAPHDLLRSASDDERLYSKLPFQTFCVRLQRPGIPQIDRLEVVLRQRATPRHPVIYVAPIVRLYVDGACHSEVANHVIREEGFRESTYEFVNVGHAMRLDIEVEAWAVGWMEMNGTIHEVSRLDAYAWREAAP